MKRAERLKKLSISALSISAVKLLILKFYPAFKSAYLLIEIDRATI